MMMNDVTFQKITVAQSWNIFDQAARRQLGMSGRVLSDLWDDGHFDDVEDTTVMSVIMLRPSQTL